MFGGDRDPQDVADEWFWFAHELRPSTYWRFVEQAAPFAVRLGEVLA